MGKHAIITALILLSSFCRADPYGYNKVITLKVETENLIVIHYHNWSDTTRESRFEMISTHQNPFTPENDYAYLMAIDKSSNDTIFKSPSPALTRIYVSDNEKYIVGISKIMLWNPYQLVIYNQLGELNFKKHIADSEARLGSTNFETFIRNYPKQHKFLDSMNRIELVNEHYFVDCFSMGMPKRLGDAWDYLYQFKASNHLSNSFGESVTNWVFWYLEEQPGLEIELLNNKIDSISLLDPSGERIKIMVD